MQEYRISELEVGHSESFASVITAEMMEQFLAISGDVNPLHLNEPYAKAQGLKGRVVYGMLTASFYSTLVGVHLPGKFSLLHSIEIQFSKPVFVGDALIINGKVSEVDERFRHIVVKAGIKNQNGESISRAKIKIGLLHE